MERSNCFANNDSECCALEEKICKSGTCKFFKTKEKFTCDKMRSIANLRKKGLKASVKYIGDTPIMSVVGLA